MNTKVTIKENASPSESPKADQPMTVTDSRGRVLALKKLDILEESRLIRMLGQETATNMVYMTSYVMPAVMVASIDGDAVFMPNSMRELEALIKRLDNDGITAIQKFVYADPEEKQSEEEAGLKN